MRLAELLKELQIRDSDDLSSASALLNRLDTRLRYKSIYLASTTSTQDVARDLAERGAPEGTLVIAESMTAGRGRRGRRWYAGPGGLWLTLILRPPPEYFQLLGLLSALAVVKSLEKLWGLRAEVKWPNDVLLEGRKLCGILAEAAFIGGGGYLLLGLGINVNNDLPPELKDSAISLKDVLRRRVPRLPLLASTLLELDSLYSSLLKGGAEDVLRELKCRMSTLGRRVRVITPDGVVEGLAVSLASDGSLLLRLSDGSLLPFRVGEVIHLR